MYNIPEVKLGIVAVSRDCFPIQLSQKRRSAVFSACVDKHINICEIKTIIENEKDVLKALKEIEEAGVNALVVYLGNFGPEGPETILAQKFDGPAMYAAAAEETGTNLINGRGDAYCGILIKFSIVFRFKSLILYPLSRNPFISSAIKKQVSFEPVSPYFALPAPSDATPINMLSSNGASIILQSQKS